jgi:FkbM family methyltransferase
VNEAVGQDAIVVDFRSGEVKGASAGEAVAIAVLRNATRALLPLHSFGSSYAARFTRALLPSRKPMVFRLSSDSLMETEYCDPYWSCLLMPGFPYEPSIRAFVGAIDDIAYGFIDGGANHGYWSIIVSGKEAGAKKVVAVEAASDTFEHLARNRKLNGDRFVALNRAIGARTGEQVTIHGTKHEARSVVAAPGQARSNMITETITIDDIADHEQFAGLDKFVVKLDLEGVEIDAFSGATRLLAADTAFIYEDHGSDRTHEVTRHALEALKLRVFWLGTGHSVEITAPAELDRIKKSRRLGYDMVATRSPFWIDRLERLVAGGTKPH